MRIIIDTIPAGNMRYDTCGDWREEDGALVVEVSDEVPAEERFLVALHELVEAELCRRRGIGQAEVDAFDMAFKGEGEPGDDPAAPYRREHRQAMLIEHMMANFLGLTGYGEVR